MSYETLQQLVQEGFRTDPGEMGEQIIIKGLRVEELKPGDHLQFGEAAQIEVTSLRTPCDWFELVQGKAKEQAVGRVGIMAKVIAGGEIRVGDAVALLSTAQS